MSEIGICQWAQIPMRHQPGESAEMVNQVLYGEKYQVKKHSEDGKWLSVTLLTDGYPGWIDAKMHTEAADDTLPGYRSCSLVHTFQVAPNKQLTLSMGSAAQAPIDDKMLWHDVMQQQPASVILQLAEQWLNVPYLWGGKTLMGVDCSGFTQVVFQACGYPIQRDASLQVQEGVVVQNVSDAGEADLAFFKNERGKITHVGIVCANQEVIHASGFVRKDYLDEQGIFNQSFKKYTHFLDSIRRYVNI